MYERSAIVLEKYYNDILGFNKKDNLKVVYKDYRELIEELKEYQKILEKEDKAINEFDNLANNIRKIQQEQQKICKSNIKLEENRGQLFNSLDEEPSVIEKKIKRIEDSVNENNKRIEELREEFVKTLTEFSQKQKERNEYSRDRREEEKNHLQIIEKTDKNIKQIDINAIKFIKDFINSSDAEKEEILELMINNGKDERVPFNRDVIKKAIEVRNQIAIKEAECYIVIYDRIRKLLLEISNDELKIDKYNKVLRDVSIKLAFLKAQKMYIVSFLDNERMTSINGLKAHKQLMLDACENFELDMTQFNNLYELILKEISAKSTKKAYKELYNKEYLKNIEEKEKSFEKEINNIKIKAGTIINSNYWRIEEIKNIYEVFQKEISEKFEKDLSEFKLEESEEIEEDFEEIENDMKMQKDEIFKKEISNEIIEYIEDDEYDEEEYVEDDDEEEYEDDDDEYDEEEYEEDDDEYDEEEYVEDDEEYDEEEYEDDDDEYDDEEYEDDDDEYDDDEYVKDDNKHNREDDEEDEENFESKNNKRGKGLFNKFFKD